MSLPSRSSSHVSRIPTSAVNSPSFASGSKEAILTLLGIPSHLCDRSDHSLQTSYKKYKAHLEACCVYDGMVSDGSWVGDKLSAIDLIELFVSKSFWHLHVKKYCSQMSNHPLMVDWLEGGEDKPSDLDVWGVEKSNYTFKDLMRYLEEAKEKGKGKGKGKKKIKVADKEDKDEGNKSHKKAKKQVK